MSTDVELPKWKCHKQVHAIKIADIHLDSTDAKLEDRETDGSAMLLPDDAAYGPIDVDAEYMRKHQPEIGGYYVVYKDGYRSFSPAEAFEEGYTRA